MRKTKLTPPQKAVLDALSSDDLAYFADGTPAFSQRELSETAGLDHPQKAVAAVMGLFMKGYLVANPEVKEK